MNVCGINVLCVKFALCRFSRATPSSPTTSMSASASTPASLSTSATKGRRDTKFPYNNNVRLRFDPSVLSSIVTIVYHVFPFSLARCRADSIGALNLVALMGGARILQRNPLHPASPLLHGQHPQTAHVFSALFAWLLCRSEPVLCVRHRVPLQQVRTPPPRPLSFFSSKKGTPHPTDPLSEK
jgi:hypothetical protein